MCDIDGDVKILNFDVLFIGQQAGKTTLIDRFVGPDSVSSSSNQDFKTKVTFVDRSNAVFRLKELTVYNLKDKAFWSSAHGVVFMFDITSQNSFNFISNIAKEISSLFDCYRYGPRKAIEKASGVVPTELKPFLVLVGTKTDLIKQRIVSEISALELASACKMWYCEVSAKTGELCSELFELMAKSIFVRENHRRMLPLHDTDDVRYFLYSNPRECHRDMRVIRSATIEKLIQELLEVEIIEREFEQIFLFMYRTFITPIELLRRLIAAFNTSESMIIKFRVITVMQKWIVHYKTEFSHNRSLAEKETEEYDTIHEMITEFCLYKLSAIRPELSRWIMNTLQSDLTVTVMPIMCEAVSSVLSSVPKGKKPPKLISPKSLNFIKMNPTEFARQVSLVEFEFYCAIQPREFLGMNWLKQDKKITSPNILRMIDFFNKMSRFYAYSILNSETPSKCSKMITHLTEIAYELEKLNNYNGLLALNGCLTKNDSITRLKKTWKIRRTRYVSGDYTCNSSENYSSYRLTIDLCLSLLIPYLGLALTDLTFIEEGNYDHLETEIVSSKTSLITQSQPTKKKLFNFHKRRMAFAVISEFLKGQKYTYNFEVEPTIRKFLLSDLPGVEGDEAYQLSLKIEPRKEK